MVESKPTDRTEDIEQNTERDVNQDIEPGRSGRKAYRSGPVEDNAGWTIFSYLISGMVVYGLIGWVVSRITHIGVLFPLGAIVGLVMAIVLIILKYGRP